MPTTVIKRENDEQLLRDIHVTLSDRMSDLRALYGPELSAIPEKYRGTVHNDAVKECWEAAVSRIHELDRINSESGFGTGMAIA